MTVSGAIEVETTRPETLLDHGDHIRDAAHWQKRVADVAPIERSATYTRGICPYHLMLCRKPA